MLIDPNEGAKREDAEAEFVFILVYTYKFGDDFYDVTLGGPITFNWKEK